jgi:hypothetical protein
MPNRKKICAEIRKSAVRPGFVSFEPFPIDNISVPWYFWNTVVKGDEEGVASSLGRWNRGNAVTQKQKASHIEDATGFFQASCRSCSRLSQDSHNLKRQYSPLSTRSIQ